MDLDEVAETDRSFHGVVGGVRGDQDSVGDCECHLYEVAEAGRGIDDEAKNVHWKHWEPVVTQMSKERGFYAPTLERYEEEVDTGALYVGSPETVAHKLAAAVRSNHLSRFDLKYDIMHLPKDVRERSIRLFGEKVAPRVRELLAADPGEGAFTDPAVARITKDGKAVHA
ncbi:MULTISPECIES: hypothetical protein [unclassified Microbacterium]|uniref:hypothetical protein n=1 Tax=unclassified Microbacterium TaxID=2609290 RepID=UPI00109BB427|nr:MULTISPECIES: hypothetical protein [unclassified Microbacterium]